MKRSKSVVLVTDLIRCKCDLRYKYFMSFVKRNLEELKNKEITGVFTSECVYYKEELKQLMLHLSYEHMNMRADKTR